MQASHSLDALAVAFDDDHAVASAGLVLTATLAQHLGLEAVINDCVDLGRRPGHFLPGRKVMTLVHSMVAGGDFIDDADVLRCASTDEVLGHRVMAPSTLGTFLRSFTFGNVRQLDRVTELVMTRAWAAGAGPGAGPMTIDIDSTICEVYGYDKQGAAFGYTKVRGYHPMVATRSGTGEVLHTRFPQGQRKHRPGCAAPRARDHRARPPGRGHRPPHPGGPTPGTGRERSSRPAPIVTFASRSRYARPPRRSLPSPRSTKAHGSGSGATPSPASPSWPRPRSTVTASSCAGSASSTLRACSSPTGVTMVLSPT